jgi:hypothetical protein
MLENERHTMIRLNKDDAGTEEWFCPTCGRRFLMQWPPNYKRTILEPGDESVTHVGGKGDMGMGLNTAEAEVEQSLPLASEETFAVPLDDQSLYPWIQWAQAVDLETRLDEV